MVSILLCTYNRENLIRETIDSILAQTYTDFELLIVDDGSTSEEAKEILKSYKDERIRLFLCEENKFYCRAANFGISQMKGDYLAMADSDDLWYPTKLERQMEYLEEHPECGACFTYAELIDENGEPAAEDFPDTAARFSTSFATSGEWMRNFLRDGNRLCHPSAVVPAWMIEKIGGFNLVLCQGADLDMWFRILREAPIYVMQEYLIQFRCHRNPQNQISGGNELKAARFMNEHMIIRRKMMKMLTDAELVKYFRCDFRNKDAQTHLELEIERAFLLMDSVDKLPDIRVLGIEKFEEILEAYGEEAVQALEEEYHTKVQDIYAWNLGHFYVDHGVQGHLNSLENRQKELEQQIVHKEIERQNLLNTRAELLKECQNLQADRKELLKEMEDLQKQIESLQKQIVQINAEYRKTQNTLEEQRQENSRMLHTLELQVLENVKLLDMKGRKQLRPNKRAQ